jgi:hypothetical protein
MKAGILDAILKKGADAVIGTAGKAIDDIFTNKEELLVAQTEIEKIKAGITADINDHFEEMGRQGNEVELAYLADIANSRAMQIAALQQSDLFSKRFVYYLAMFVIVSATGFGFALMFWEIPDGNKRLVELFADMYLLAGALIVLSFFFGSSKSSQDKTDILKQATK